MESVDSMETPVSRLGDDRAGGVHRARRRSELTHRSRRRQGTGTRRFLPRTPEPTSARYVGHPAQCRLLDPSIDANEDSDSPLMLRYLAV